VQVSFQRGPKTRDAAKKTETPNSNFGRYFSFGIRRFASTGPRRLFQPQKCLLAPVFEPSLGRPGWLMRVLSSLR